MFSFESLACDLQHEFFSFGPSRVFEATKRMNIPAGIQACALDIRCSAIPGCSMPMLGSLTLMKELDIVVHSCTQRVDLRALNVFAVQAIITPMGHLAIRFDEK